jgi:hypothetical protein
VLPDEREGRGSHPRFFRLLAIAAERKFQRKEECI